MIGFIAQRVGAHGQLDLLSHDTIGADDDGAVFLNFAGAAASAAHNDIDIGLFAEL